MTKNKIILSTENLTKEFKPNSNILDKFFSGGDNQSIRAVDDVSFSVPENEVVGLIGESGCGKTTLLNLIIGLLSPTSGKVMYDGKDISDVNRKELSAIREEIQMIFQDPFDSLDPKFTVRETIQEPLKVHNYDDHEERTKEVLRDVELKPPDRYMDRKPSQLSGGEKQRVSIARALVLNPEILLADEPVSMLDVSTQTSILNLLSDITSQKDLSMVYISHDISTVAYVCNSINVMYLGRLVESSPTLELINDPKHPYTKALIESVPIPNPFDKRDRTTITGSPEDTVSIDDGCRFRDRCPEEMEICQKTPRLVEVGSDHQVACHLYYDHEQDDEVNP